MSPVVYLHDLPRWAIRPLAASLAPRGPVAQVIVHRKPAPAVWAEATRTMGDAVRLTPLNGMRWRAAIWRAQATSLDVTEALWRELPAARAGRILNRFFDDPHGEYALRKALILDVESRLEAIFAAGELAEETGLTVRLAAASPLDAAILGVVRRQTGTRRAPVELWDRDPYRRAERRHAAGAKFRALGRSVLWLGGIPVRRGIRWRAPRPRPFFKVASDNKWAPGSSVTLGRADDVFLVDGERIRVEDALVLLNPHQPGAPREAYTAAGIAVVEPERLPVPLDYWLGTAIPRFARLLIAALAIRGDAVADVVVRKAVEIGLAATGFGVLLRYVRIGVLTSVVEYDPAHVVKTLLLNRDGGAQVRLPHSHMDYPGAALSYLHYDMFWSAGEYLPAVWGTTWSPRTRAMSVGLLFGHAAEGSADSASPGAQALVTALGAQGRRIVTVYTSSNTEATYASQATAQIDLRTLTLVMEACGGRDDVVVLIKPKLGHESFLDTAPFRELLAPHVAAGRVHIIHPRWSTGCAAGYLLRRSEVNVAYGGSVVIEALQAAVPVLVPLVGATHMTPFVQKFLGTVFFEDQAEFVDALRALLDGKRASSFDAGVVREWFDPFEDGAAIQRMRDSVAALLERR